MKNLHSVFIFLAFVSMLSLPEPSRSESQSSDEQPITIFVTSSRVELPREKALAAHTLISEEEIAKQQAKSVSDVLDGVVGVDVNNTGGVGKQTSIFLRGTESDHVLVLIDGIRVGSATSSTAALSDLPVEQIERIEVVRGPFSSLYGSEAIGGVIQIFTKKGGGKRTLSGSLGFGSYDTINSSVGLSGGGENSWYGFNFSSLQTDGFDSCDGSSTQFAGCFIEEPDADGYDRQSGSMRLGHRFTEGTELEFHSLYTQSDVDFDGSFQNQSDNAQWVAGASLKTDLLEQLRMQINLGTSVDESDSFKDGVFASRFETHKDNASVQNQWDIQPSHQVTFGLDYYHDQLESNTNYTETSRENTGAFTQYRALFGDFTVTTAIRRDSDTQFGSHTTESIATGYEVSETLRFVLSYGSAFKAPTFNDLYFPGFSNENLEPEESTSYEFQVHTQTGPVRWSTALFSTDVDQLIALDEFFIPQNISQAQIRGVEVESQWRSGPWGVRSQLAITDAESQGSGDNNGNRLPRRAREQFSLQASRDFGYTDVEVVLKLEGDRFDDLANNTKLAGFGTVDLNLDHQINKQVGLQLKVENLFDKDYEKAAFFNQAGRGVYATIDFKH